MKDSESTLRDGDIHDVCGTDTDGSARLRQNDELISMNRTLVLDWVRSYLKKKDHKLIQGTIFYFNLKYSTAYISSKTSFFASEIFASLDIDIIKKCKKNKQNFSGGNDQIFSCDVYLQLQVPPAFAIVNLLNQRLPHSVKLIKIVHLRTRRHKIKHLLGHLNSSILILVSV